MTPVEEKPERYGRLVLFGAGASFGSVGVIPTAPPMGSQLYPVLARAFPDSWGAVSPDLRTKFDQHFEEGMSALWEMYPMAFSPLKPGAPSPHSLMQDLARFFLSFRLVPGYKDVYSRMLISLWNSSKGVHTSIATLNYEHLLEQAMIRLRLPPRVLRPHGGCQFWLKRGGTIWWREGYTMGKGMNSISARIMPLPRREVESRLDLPNQGKYPCMAMYLEGKVTQMGQRYLRRVQHRLRNRVTSSTSIAIVGVRPWPSDSHIWSSIADADAIVHYVGGEVDFAMLREMRGSRATRHVGARIEECIEDVVAAL
ncbi:MAG: hypothetical protein KJZ69_11545 [Phycisphaerales bacterium]|nr:hypothetical protein [Phycisphaerales bacterium]